MTLRPTNLVLTALFAFVLFSISLPAQNLGFGLFGGVSAYDGDLSPRTRLEYLDDLSPAVGAYVRYDFNDWLGTRVNLMSTRIKAQGGRSQTTPYSSSMRMRNDMLELSALLEVTPFRINWFRFAELQPYGFTGVAYLHHNPEFSLPATDGYWVDVAPLNLEGQGLDGYPEDYSQNIFILPVGGGLRVAFNDRWSISFQATARVTFNDYLDDISNTLITYDDLARARGPEIAELSNPAFDDSRPRYVRGNGANDYLWTAGVTVQYRLTDILDSVSRFSKCYKMR